MKRTERYSSVLVANGHHWDPRYPEPAFPGAGDFTGEQIHSHYYRTPEPFTGKRVLVVGIGNSACDIGLVQPIGTTMPLAEAQSQWVADLLQGPAALPPQAVMEREIASYPAAAASRHAHSTRHLIQVDFLAYLREIRRERRAGARRGGARWTVPAARPVPGQTFALTLLTESAPGLMFPETLFGDVE